MIKTILTKDDLNRQTNYMLVNSKSKKSFIDSVIEAELYLEMDNKFKIIYTAPEETGIIFSKMTPNLTSRSVRGKIHAIENPQESLAASFDILINQFKYGLLIISNQNLNADNYNIFNSDSFKKKSIDIVKHQESLFLTDPELAMLKKSIKEAKSGEDISRNFIFKIYPDKSFEFNKQSFIELKKQHESIDVLGLMIAHYAVNTESMTCEKEAFKISEGDKELINMAEIKEYTEKPCYYNYFSREIIGVNKTSISSGLHFISKELNLNENLISFAKRIWLDEKALIVNIKEPVESITTTPLDNKNEENTDKVILNEEYLENVTDNIVDDIMGGNIPGTTQQEAVEYLIKIHKEKELEQLIDLDSFMLKVGLKVQEKALII